MQVPMSDTLDTTTLLQVTYYNTHDAVPEQLFALGGGMIREEMLALTARGSVQLAEPLLVPLHLDGLHRQN
jgi:hypothetical protein